MNNLWRWGGGVYPLSHCLGSTDLDTLIRSSSSLSISIAYPLSISLSTRERGREVESSEGDR